MMPQGYVLGPREGEHLVLRGGDIFIKVDPTGGSRGLAMGTQQILVGAGIPIHRHLEMDEAFYVDSELILLWTVAPSGLECFFREVASRPGAPAIQRTKERLNEIARRYGTEFR